MRNEERITDMHVWVPIRKDLAHENLVRTEDVAFVPVFWESLKLLKIVLGKVWVVERGRFYASVSLLEPLTTVILDEPPPEVVVTVGVECEKAFARRVMLTETTTEL